MDSDGKPGFSPDKKISASKTKLYSFFRAFASKFTKNLYFPFSFRGILRFAGGFCEKLNNMPNAFYVRPLP